MPLTDAEITRSLGDDLPLGIWVARAPGGELVYANRTFREIMGMEARAEVVGVSSGAAASAPLPSRILIVDDNPGVLRWLESVLSRAGYSVSCADTLEKATELARTAPDAALLDYLLPDGDGLTLAVDLAARVPRVPVALMTGMSLPLDEAMVCQSTDIPVLHKPFRDADVLGLIEQRLLGLASREAAH